MIALNHYTKAQTIGMFWTGVHPASVSIGWVPAVLGHKPRTMYAMTLIDGHWRSLSETPSAGSRPVEQLVRVISHSSAIADQLDRGRLYRWQYKGLPRVEHLHTQMREVKRW